MIWLHLFASAVLASAVPQVGTLELGEASGATLRVEEGVLVRLRDGERRVLAASRGEQPGRILDLAADPAGLTFVAAENGLYVLGPLVEALDRVEALDEVPVGRPTGVEVDRARRVWLATEEGLWVLEPSYYFARRRALPAAASYGVSSDSEGRISFHVGTERLACDPGASPPPRVTRLCIDGEELAPGARLTRASGGELRIQLEGEARGGATFRYRRNGHHVWRSFSADERLPMPHAGSHTLEFVALDEDLDFSAPFLVRLSVAYPFYYSGAFVVGTGLGFALLAGLFFLWRGRALHGRVLLGRVLASTAVTVVFAVQLAAALEPHAKGWPFVGFGMYTRRFDRHDIVYSEHIVLLRPDGSELLVRPQSAGIVVDEPWEILRPMIDRGAPALAEYLAKWKQRYPQTSVNGIQIQARRFRLSDHGPVAIAPLVQAHYREPRDD